jgi:hypothetical protein
LFLAYNVTESIDGQKFLFRLGLQMFLKHVAHHFCSGRFHLISIFWNCTSATFFKYCFWCHWKLFFLTGMHYIKFCVMLIYIMVKRYSWAIVNLAIKCFLICLCTFYVYYHTTCIIYCTINYGNAKDPSRHRKGKARQGTHVVGFLCLGG